MSLLYLLAKRIHELVSKVVTQQRNTAEDLCEIEAVATSCIAVFVALDHRLHELTYGWRLEAKDVGMQVDRYADGLFKKYYTKVRLFAPLTTTLTLYNHRVLSSLGYSRRPTTAYAAACSETSMSSLVT